MTADLTRRELDVLRVYCRTHNYKETGAALGMSPKTVQAHLTSARMKLDAVDSWDACDKARAGGLLGTAA